MHTITNTSAGVRGFHAESGFVQLTPGQEWTGAISDGEVKSAKATGYFKISGGKAGAEQSPDGLDGMTVPELKKLAEDEKIDVSAFTKKADIIGAIRGLRQVPADTRTDDELRAAVIEQLGTEDGVEALDREAMINLLANAE